MHTKDKELNLENKKIFINKRPAFFAAVFIILGVVFAAATIGNGVVFLVFACVFLGLLVATIVLKRKSITFLLLCLMFGVMLFNVAYLPTLVPYTDEYAVIVGRVSRANSLNQEDGRNSYVLDDVWRDEEALSRNVVVFTYDSLEIGDFVRVVGRLTSQNYDPFNSRTMYNYSHGVNYRLDANSTSVVSGGNFKALDRLYIRIRNTVFNNMGEREGAIAMGLIFGDRGAIGPEFSLNSRAAGVAHIFSVSGLHVGIAAAFILFILKKLGVKRNLAYIIALSFVLLYGFIAMFPAGMIRATVMLAVVMLSHILFKRNDPLTSLSVASIIIVTLFPLSVFQVGFQLSVTAVLGIISFYKPIKNFFYKGGQGKTKKFVAESAAVTISANTYMLGVAFSNFSSFGTYFILANVLIVSLIGVAFPLVIICLLIALIIPPLGFLLAPPALIFALIGYITQFIASLPFSTIAVGQLSGAFAFVYILTMFLMSKFVVMENKYKFRILTAVLGFSVLAALATGLF
jgi:ComEC/Rec2-related protein